MRLVWVIIPLVLLFAPFFSINSSQATVCSGMYPIFITGSYDYVALIGTVQYSEIIEVVPTARSVDNAFFSKRVTEYKIDEQIYGDRSFELDTYTMEQYWGNPTEPYESGTQRVIPLYYYDYDPDEPYWKSLTCFVDFDMSYVNYINWVKDLKQDSFFKFDFKQHTFANYVENNNQESFVEKYSLETIDFTIHGGTVIEFEDDSRASSIILHVEMDTDGDVVVTNTYRMSANPDCTPTDDFFVLIDGEEVESGINENDHSLSIKIPKDSKVIEIISTWPAVTHTTSSMYAEFCKVLDGGKHMAPNQQIKIGFLPRDIICKDNLTLILPEIHKSVCVKPSTAEKLIQRGWTS